MIAVTRNEDGFATVDVAEGQRHDARLAALVLAEARAAVGTVDELLGDKGFDIDSVRGVIPRELDAQPVILNRANRKDLWPWDDEMAGTYKERNWVERGFGKAKQSRGLAAAMTSSRTSTSGWCG